MKTLKLSGKMRTIDVSRRPKPVFYECGCCGGMHSVDLPGDVDCRDDAHRFTCEALCELYGETGWVQVDQPE